MIRVGYKAFQLMVPHWFRYSEASPALVAQVDFDVERYFGFRAFHGPLMSRLGYFRPAERALSHLPAFASFPLFFHYHFDHEPSLTV